MEHGKYSTYRKYKCRCEECKLAAKTHRIVKSQLAKDFSVEPKDYVIPSEVGVYNKGYLYFNDVKNPLAMTNGAVLLHRQVYASKVNRWLNPDEVVHHVDENKLNNHPDNLELTIASEHARHHTKDGVMMASKFWKKGLSWFVRLNSENANRQRLNYMRVNDIKEMYFYIPEKDPQLKIAEKRGRRVLVSVKDLIKCNFCGEKVIQKRYNQKYCSYKCSFDASRKVKNRPSKEDLILLVSQYPMTKIGEIYKVSDNAVRKWCKQYGINLPDMRGYWNKVYAGKIEIRTF